MFVNVSDERIMGDVVREWQEKFPEEVHQFFHEQKINAELEKDRDKKGFTKGRTLQLLGRIPARIVKGLEFFTDDPDFWVKNKGKNLFKFASMFPAFGGKVTGWSPK